MKKYLVLLIIFCSFLLLAPAANKTSAMEFITGETVSVPKDTVIDGSVFISGNSVSVSGEINGDVFCAGQDVTITGPVHGDVICAGQTLHINNVTDGNIRLAGQMIEMAGSAGKNASVFGQTITVAPNGSINGELLTASQILRIDGHVGRDIQGWSQSVSVGDGATISGNLSYTSDQDATIAQEASIAGRVTKSIPKPGDIQPMHKPFTVQPDRSRGIGFLVTALVFGVIAVLLGPAAIGRTLTYTRHHWAPVLGRGLLVVVIAPIVIILLAITLIGIPVAIVLGAAVAILYFLGRVIMVILVGRVILENIYKRKADSLWWGLGAGALFLWALFTVPVLGGIASFLLTLFGFGAATVLLFPKTISKR